MQGIFGQISDGNITMNNEGLQPITDVTRRYQMVLSGEFYDGNTPQSVLEAYISLGAEALNTLDGVFAIAIWDSEKQRLFLARDRFGCKMLYYHLTNDGIVFSSDIPAILTTMPAKPIPDDDAIFDYLVFNRTDQTERTFFRDIKKLQHGHYLWYDGQEPSAKGRVKIIKWYDLTVAVEKRKAEMTDRKLNEAQTERFMALFRRAIEKRIAGDKKWGLCLSGGLDSSAIVSTIINDMHKPDVHTFSSVYGQEYEADESRFIKEFSDIVPNMHYAIPNGKDLFENMMDIIRCQVEPTPGTSPFALYCVLKEAQPHVSVVLDGQGSDEALAGYEYIPGLYYKSLLTHFHWYTWLRENIRYLMLHHSTRSLRYTAFFLLPKRLRTKVRVAQRGYINPDFVAKHQDSVIADKLYGATTMQEMLINHFEFKLEHLLKWGERNVMHFDMVGRSPFMDIDLIEYAIALDDSAKVHNGWTKYILREAMKGIMPECVRQRVDKNGFNVPQEEWFREPQFEQFVRELLSSKSFAKRGYVVPEKALAMYERHLRGEINISKDIWKWINLELWFRMFID